jgi:glycosyltransferase involved in cell wall biosynthesis
VNGFQVKPRDVDGLAAAQQAFLDDEELAARMGSRSRKLAEERFDVHKVNHVLLDAMGL